MRKPIVKLVIAAGCAALLLSLGYKLSMKSERLPKRLLGPSKSVHTLGEMQAHPICLWGEDGDGLIGGDETWTRSWLGKPNVTREMFLPEILLRVKGTNLWATGQYYRERKLLDAIGIFGPDGQRPPFWYIQTAGTPITYVAVPAIEGRKNVEFIAKNRRREQALMSGAFTPEQAERAYEAEIDSNMNNLKWPAIQIHRDPELLKLAVAFLQRIARDVLADSGGVVFTDVGGWLEDEDPEVYERLLREATTKQIRFLPISRIGAEHDLIVDSETKQKGVLVMLTGWRTTNDLYAVSGYWSVKSEGMQNVERRIRNVGGTWTVEN